MGGVIRLFIPRKREAEGTKLQSPSVSSTSRMAPTEVGKKGAPEVFSALKMTAEFGHVSQSVGSWSFHFR